jgi:hypothetical protein
MQSAQVDSRIEGFWIDCVLYSERAYCQALQGAKMGPGPASSCDISGQGSDIRPARASHRDESFSPLEGKKVKRKDFNRSFLEIRLPACDSDLIRSPASDMNRGILWGLLQDPASKSRQCVLEALSGGRLRLGDHLTVGIECIGLRTEGYDSPVQLFA